MKTNLNDIRWLIVLACAVWWCVTAAGAPADIEPDTTVVLNEVNVTAIKQADRLRDDAVSSTLLTAAELEQGNIESVKGMSDMVPNFFVPDYGSRITSTMYVRGIGARMDQPAVGLNVDNVPYLNKNAYDMDLSDISTIEMLRGPQSTLYGRNTIGGLINITTLSPMRWQGIRIMASGAVGNDWRGSVGWYHKIRDGLAVSVSGSLGYLGGFYRNDYDGKFLDHELGGGLRSKIEWRNEGGITIQNVLGVSLLRQGGYPYESVETGRISYNDSCYYRRAMVSDGLTVQWRHDRFTMSSITSVQYLNDNMTLDQDFLPASYFTLTQKQREISVTEDVVIRGEEAEGCYKWVAGAFVMGKHMTMHAPVTFKDDGISELIESHRNDANPDYPISWDSRRFVLGSRFRIPTFGAAVYHKSEYRAGRFKISAGIRLDWEMSRLNYESECNTGYTVYKYEEDGNMREHRHVNVLIDDSGRLRRQYLNWLPSLEVMYNLPTEGENNVYANIAKGYKAGGFNTQMFSDVLQQRLMGVMGIGSKYEIDDVVGYKPEYSWNYEVGGHFTFLDSRLKLDWSLFYIDCRDQQLTMFPDGTTTGRIMTNAGRTRSYGGELSVIWIPLEHLRIGGSYGYTDARFVRFDNGINDYRGKYLPYAPGQTVYGSVTYDFNIRNRHVSGIRIGADVRCAGRIYWNESNSLWQDLYALVGAMAEIEGEHWSLQIWGKNLANTRYDTFYFMSMGNEFVQRGRPIQIGATLRLSF